MIDMTEEERRAEKMYNGLDVEFLVRNEETKTLIWEYFRDGKDHLALMMMQAVSLADIAATLREAVTDSGEIRVSAETYEA